MSHRIYHTEGFVLGGQPVGEANKYFRIFTKDFGMIGATAQGVRLIQSKLRYSLQDYSYSRISLVRGKNTWKIIGAIKEKNLFESLNDCGKFDIIAKAFLLLNRLVRGEEKNEPLFNHILYACEFIERSDFDLDYLKNCEYILVMRILQSLGYGGLKNFMEIADSFSWTEDILSKMCAVRMNAISYINKALKETQL